MPIGGTILVLDGDSADLRFAELGLGKAGRFQIETANSCEAAFELLRGHVIDLILTEVELVDGDAFHLMKRIRARPGGKDLPVVFLTRDRRTSVLVAALQSGAVDLLVKPFNLQELLARIDAVIARYRERRLDVVTRSYSLAGELGAVAFADLIHLLEIGNRDGQLFFTTERGVGEIKLQKGRIVDASFGSIGGEAAFFALMREERGRFEFQPGLPPGRTARSITAATTSLLMEGARQLDMHRLQAAPAVAVAHGDGDAAPAAEGVRDGGLVALPPAMTPTPDYVQDLVRIVGDPFSLGELQFLNRGQLIDYHAQLGRRPRCTGLLIAPCLAGVSALAGMAAPLGEPHIASALEWDQRVLQWTLSAANGATIDLLLIDCAMPAMVLDDLRREVAFVVYAPPTGDHLALAHHAPSELVAVLGRLRPQVLKALGNATIGAYVDQLCSDAGCAPRVLISHRPIEDPGTDLRDCLVEVLGEWGRLGKVHA